MGNKQEQLILGFLPGSHVPFELTDFLKFGELFGEFVRRVLVFSSSMDPGINGTGLLFVII